ncbi:MAG: cell division protein ZapA [Alloprevotella sp.]|nr:cell division protein ZapA [Alloprevotella sp.]MBR1652211.1 cell division protein ZapA [Alloprevotella sp.]
MAEKSNKLNVNLLIDRTEYALKVLPEEEEIFRGAAKLINNKLARYQERFPMQGTEKYYAFVMLDLATDLLRQAERNDTQPYVDSIRQLTAEMEEALGMK